MTHSDGGAGIAIGVDIGGTGIKGAGVDLRTGELVSQRIRLMTPKPSTPAAVAQVVTELVDALGVGPAPLGVTFPAVVVHGVARSAANVDPSWIGTDITSLLGSATGRTIAAVNDADAAGLAEATFGAARGVPGLVLMVTLGTGIGSALIVDGHLVPNTELGHLQIDGVDAESRAADSAREREDLSWREWAARLQRYFDVVIGLFSPDLIVVGGGVSKRHDEFLPLLDLPVPVVPATLRNTAGFIGAALLAGDVDG
jgi:polyphosphate glucokinase